MARKVPGKVKTVAVLPSDGDYSGLLPRLLELAEADDIVHGPLEILATVDEEVGLTGAGKIKPGFLKGSILLNLDSEELGEVTIGCAGGGDSTLTLPLSRIDAPAGTKPYVLKVFGLRGGHSGIDIHEQRGNAIKIITRLVAAITAGQPAHLVEIRGGNKRNAIPREAFAELMILETAAGDVEKLVADEISKIAIELGGKEKDLGASISPAEDGGGKVLADESRSTLLDLLLVIPHGVEAMNYDIEGLVETSNNVAVITTGDDSAVLTTSHRSSVMPSLYAVQSQVRSVCRLAGATVEVHDAYPGWKPNPDSPIVKKTVEVYEKLFGETPELKAIHAGLECGLLIEKKPGMDVVSIGPEIKNAHSPDEMVQISSVQKFYEHLKALLAELA